MKRTVEIIVFCLFMLGCNSGANRDDSSSDSAVTKTSQNETSDSSRGETSAVNASENGVISQIKMKPMLLFGQYIETDRSAFYNSLQLLTPGITRQVTNAGAAITGAMTFLYDSLPTESGVLRVFVAVPVNKKFKVEGETGFISIEGGDYYKLICNSEMGQTGKFHAYFQNWLMEKNLVPATPVLETASESRNNEMTVVPRMNLFYKIP